MTRSLLTLIVLLFPLAGCGGEDTSAALKLYVFDCGHLMFDTVSRFSIEDDETDVRELIVPCYVIEHPDGVMLWDGGLPSSWVDPDARADNARLDQSLAEQLAALDLGFDLRSLDYVAFSHMHYDHVGVANEVEGATWLVQRASSIYLLPGRPTPTKTDTRQSAR